MLHILLLVMNRLKPSFCYFHFFDVFFASKGHFLFRPYLRTALIFQMDGWMTCDFTSFLTVFQSYQDDVRMIMKGYVQWNSVYG